MSITYVGGTESGVTDAYGKYRTYTLVEVDGIKRLASWSGTAAPPYDQNNVVGWQYDGSMNLGEVEYASGVTVLYGDYDYRGLPGTVIYAQRTITFTYHPYMNRPLTRTEASVLGGENKVTIWDYDSDGNDTPNESPTMLLYRLIERGYTSDISGTVSSYEYITRFTYNAKGQVTSIDGPISGENDKTIFAYHGTTGDLVSIQRPLIGYTTFGTDGAGAITVVTDVNGNQKSIAYNGRGRITQITHEDLSTTIFEYDKGQLDWVKDQDGIYRYFDYDAGNGKVSRIRDAESNFNYIAYGYDSRGNRISMGKYDSSNNLTEQVTWDYNHPSVPGKLWKETKNGKDIVYGYDSAGNINSVKDPKLNETQYLYDIFGRLESVTQPGNILTLYTYDTHGNLNAVQDGEVHTTTYQYDDMGRLVNTSSPDTGIVRYEYDAAGNLLKKKDAKAATIVYEYDHLYRLTKADFPNDTDMVYTYDQGTYGKGQLTAITDAAGGLSFGYDIRGRLVNKTNTLTGYGDFTMSRVFTPGGKQNVLTYPSGRTANVTRNALGQIQAFSTYFSGVTNNLVSDLTYRPFGSPKGLSTGSGGEVDNQFGSGCGCLEKANPGTPREVTFTYDNNGNLTSMSGTTNPFLNQSFTYDSLNRLTNAIGRYGAISYTYDGVGNRLTRNVNYFTEENYRYMSGSNKISWIEVSGTTTVNMGYDDNGNITSYGNMTLTWNEDNRLLEVKDSGVTTIATYAYNALGQRVMKATSGVTTLFVYDFDGNLITEIVSGATQEYLYMGGVRMARVDASSGASYFFLNDRLGTPQYMTYGSGTTIMWEGKYEPFGEASIHPQSGVSNHFRFPGQYADTETGFHYNYHRYYDPRTGRYLTPDPIGLEAGINVFAYVGNNPVMFADPLGLCPPGTHQATQDEAEKILDAARGIIEEGLFYENIKCNQFVDRSINKAFPGALPEEYSTYDIRQGKAPFENTKSPAVGVLALLKRPSHVVIVSEMRKNKVSQFLGSQTSTGPTAVNLPDDFWQRMFDANGNVQYYKICLPD